MVGQPLTSTLELTTLMSLFASVISFFKAHQAAKSAGVGSSAAMPEGCYSARVLGLLGFCFPRFIVTNTGLVFVRLQSASAGFLLGGFGSVVRVLRLALHSFTSKTVRSSLPSPNPAVERTGREAAFAMSCYNLHIPGSCHVPWSASPSLLR